jgi:serine/threonine protein kinase/WD40 repeat protein
VSIEKINKEEIFNIAADIEDPAERSSYLEDVCKGNHKLRADIESLLRSDRNAGGFLESPPLAANITMADSPLTEVPGTIIGRYKLLDKIGEGGFGEVWAAEQKKPVKRRVALKIIKLGMDTKQVVARFEAERQALALMDHPNIAKVLDAGSTDAGRPYFVMELVRGIPITNYCDQAKLSTHDRLNLFIKVCNAVQHAHQKGIIHRDIKPSNILITLHDGVPVPRIIDFGIAKATQQELTEMTIYTRHDQFIGTPAYMSPEQAEMSGLDIDTRSDIYSLGVLLYELLTGKTPFDEKELMKSGVDQMRKIIREQDPPKPSTKFATLEIEEQSTTATRHSTDSPRLISLLRGDLDWIVMKCLEKDRTRRYETANGLALDVTRYLKNEPVIARPPTVFYQLQKAWRRNKTIYTAAIFVVIALLLGTVISVWQAWIATVAHREADAAKNREYILRSKAEEGERKQRLIAYSSDMKVAQEYLKDNNLGQVNELLNRYVPQPEQEDLRGIEWRYLWQASRGDQIFTFLHETMVCSISLSADGSRLASVALDGKVRLYDLGSRKLIRVYEGGSKFTDVISAALSPNGNLLAADQQGILRVWNADNGEIILEQEHVKAPVSFSPDSRFLAATTETGLRIWNTADWTSRLLGDPLVTGYKPSLAFTPDSNRIIFSPKQKPDAPSPQEQFTPKLMVYNLTDNTKEGELTGLDLPSVITTDGNIVAAGGFGGDVCVWDLASRRVIKKFRADSGVVYGLDLSPDGKILATGGNDQVIRLWDTKTFENIRLLKGHRNEIWDLKFSNNGQILVSASKDHSVKLWDLKRRQDMELEYTFPIHLHCQGFSESGDVLRFYDPNEWELPLKRTISRSDYLLDLATGRWTRVTRSDNEVIAHATSMTWGPGQDKYLFGMEDGTVVISDGMTAQSIHVTDHPVEPLLLSPKEHYLLLNVLPKDAKHYAILWNVEAKEVIGQYPEMMQSPRRRQVISPNEHFLAYLSEDFTIKLWLIPEKREWATLRGHSWNLSGVAFSADNRLLASFGWEAECRLWDVEKGAKASPHLLQGHRSGVGQAIFSTDGRTLATSSGLSSRKLWSVATGQELLSFPSPQVIQGGGGIPIMSPNGNYLIWGSDPLLGDTEKERTFRVARLPSLTEIDEEIRQQSIGESSSGNESINAIKTKQRLKERR